MILPIFVKSPDFGRCADAAFALSWVLRAHAAFSLERGWRPLQYGTAAQMSAETAFSRGLGYAFHHFFQSRGRFGESEPRVAFFSLTSVPKP
jgi:hypothetical protein